MDNNTNLIVNSNQTNLLRELTSSIETCNKFYFSVAFINFSGLQLLLDVFQEANIKNKYGKIITSTYLNFTDPKALQRLKEFQHIDTKVFVTDKNIGFHTKAYIFEYDDTFKVIIGSSNITQSALKSNIEWNMEIISKTDETFIQQVLAEFNHLWKQSTVVDDYFIQDYKQFFEDLKKVSFPVSTIYEKPQYITANSMQRRAIENLERLRSINEEKALVIAATGTGKTFMSAFDVRKVQPKRLLFVVHQEEILKDAKEAFQLLLKNFNVSFGLLTGNQKDLDADYIFATNKSLVTHLEYFTPDTFEYIIYDEAHHVMADTYQKVLQYFTPKFMLGMTATPERGDSQTIFEVFDHNVALEVRLHDALEDNIVVPFHYFGITDIEEVDLSNISIENLSAVTKLLKVNKRVDFILEKMQFYGYDGPTRKCLGFCATVEHATYMAEQFNIRNVSSAVLSGNDSSSKRETTIKRLEDPNDPLEVIFTVDIFNEGVDIPSVNTVLMLRPTNSPIIFIQQLGRGLRKHADKSFLTVLDFIGNHAKTFLIAVALQGARYYDKDSLKVAIATGFPKLPGASHIHMDKIAQQQILEQIDNETFTAMKYLKEEYFEFKKLYNGHIPYLLIDYYRYDGAPDPVAFINKKNSYIHFVASVEKENHLKKLLTNEWFDKTVIWLSKMLPLKRIYEFVLLYCLMDQPSISLFQLKKEIKKWVKDVNEDSVLHTMEYLNHDYFDTAQKKRIPKLISFHESIATRTERFHQLLQEQDYKKYIFDIVEYGLFRYEREFGNLNYGIPHFKLYEQYNMLDVALLSNYRKTHSSYRGSGLLTNEAKDHFFLFIDLHKEADIKDSIKYNDKIVDSTHFQWETPNNTTPNSERGKDIIYNTQRGIKLHLFIRKYKEIEKNTIEPYIYIGTGNTVKTKGEKPIEVLLSLNNTIPSQLYIELTKKV